MKTISTLDLRNKLGRVIDEVHYTRKPVLVLKKNKPVVQISMVEENKRSAFDFAEYKRLVNGLPRRYRFKPSRRLFNLVGKGDYVALEDEDEIIYQYLKQKHEK